MSQNKIYKETFKVRSYQMDMKIRATVTSLAGYFQEVAGNHADELKLGYKHMKQSGLIWLLTRFKIHVHQYPKWGDELKVSTWVVNAEKYFSRRDFEITDKSGNIMVSAVSGWMLVNAKEKRPQLVDAVLENIEMMPEKMAIQTEIQKIETIHKHDSISNYRVKYSDIDLVNHVNNIRYYSIILDTLPYEFCKNNHIKTFEINYLSEALPDEELEIITGRISEKDEFRHEIRKYDDKKALCRAAITWEKD